jgi:prevent-host-death family protein
MTSVTLTEFRSHASGMLTRVENGETLVVLRHGRPIAEVCPVTRESDQLPSWKRPALRLTAKGAALSSAIREDRSR